MNFIFKLAIFLIPFDNLFFAPSSGWAAVTPILFFIYVLQNFKCFITALYKEKGAIRFFLFSVCYSFFLYIIYPPQIINIIDSVIALILGLSFYFALILRYIIFKKDFNKDMKILILGYTISFFYGVVKYAALKLNILFILNLFRIIEKRYYSRVAFSFTEPSFISLHIFGVLLILYLLLYKKKFNQKMLVLISGFSLLTIISNSSGRFIMDLFIVISMYTLYTLFSSKITIKTKTLIFPIILSSCMAVLITFLNNPRISRILDEGIYQDASLASRYFRINASIEGYKNEPIKALFGTGLGSSFYFLQYGYEDAYKQYANSYIEEIRDVEYSKSNQLFCMPIRFISEFGIINFIFFIILVIYYVYKYQANKLVLLIIFWLYMQFDSYAFYSIWLYLFLTKYKNQIAEEEERIEYITN